jgi:hypothetical protein
VGESHAARPQAPNVNQGRFMQFGPPSDGDVAEITREELATIRRCLGVEYGSIHAVNAARAACVAAEQRLRPAKESSAN